MYHVLWEYEVRPEGVAAFETLYRPDGAWASLFRGTEAYVATELFRDTARPTHFLTLDRWTSRAAYEAFLPTVRETYERLDRQCEALTVHERRLAAFSREDS
jgi:quinol monooxygenase YgiN